MPKFFISCPINLEPICAQEIALKWPYFLDSPPPKLNTTKGGIEIECEYIDGLSLNHILKTPSKVLLRIKEQKCKDIPKLYNIIRKFNWKQFLKRKEVIWNISSSKSRLINTKKMQKACEDALNDYFNANALSQKVLEDSKFSTQEIQIRIHEDNLSISINTSGELLHIRGDRSFRGHASIRENLAASLLIKLLGTTPINAKLLDPMCGTATFLSEAKNFFKPSTRDYDYYNWHTPCKIKAIQNIWKLEQFARDIDPNITKKIQVNNVNIETIDLFEDKDSLSKVDFIILNPPYGKRVKIQSSPTQFFEKLLNTITNKYSFKKLGILIPETVKLYKNEFNGYAVRERFPFNNNGIKINFFILEK